MGIEIESARFLLGAKESGVCFDHTLTLGRQHYFASRSETKSLLSEIGKESEFDRAGFPNEYPHYAEPFWRLLGANTIDSMDASSFEDANIVHDLNSPVPESLKLKYDALCDVGTLEHVFNFPMAIKNCMEMLKVGGRFFTFTPSNNYCGHGFYQFSPELFYQIFNDDNGFEVERIVAVEYGPGRCWNDVNKPSEIKSRVNVINSYPVLLFVQARKTEDRQYDKLCPQQSDYQSLWNESSEVENKEAKTKVNADSQQPSALVPSAKGKLKTFLLNYFPKLSRSLESIYTARFDKNFSFKNKVMYKRNSKKLNQ